ncbi:uncharacterized protein LOC129356431 isoform X2 [Poeciliopsis prolifica]|uniref:uncharacterized protein LOC129356431 isoform X2 n=1 Tax=Poeciliopsis prolifica TaxID=188132 RepID=UPI002413F23A|nr:uncharacterized protein LOC129356431 isoform X2 [Poeciliopsis prolifica]
MAQQQEVQQEVDFAVGPTDRELIGSEPREQTLTEVQKTEYRHQKKERAEPPGSISPSMRSDRSKGNNPKFSDEPGSSDRKGQNHRWRAEPPGPISPSMRSDRSKPDPPDFSNEPGSSEPESSFSEEELPSCCALGQNVLMDPGWTSCPQCGKRPRTGSGPDSQSEQPCSRYC